MPAPDPPLIGLSDLPPADELVVVGPGRGAGAGRVPRHGGATAGGRPVLAAARAADERGRPPRTRPDETEAALVGAGVGPVLDVLDGLVVIGGGDVAACALRSGSRSPQRRHERPARRARAPAPRRRARAGPPGARHLPRASRCSTSSCGGDLVQHLPDRLGSTAHQPAAGAFGRWPSTPRPAAPVRRLLGRADRGAAAATTRPSTGR